MREQRSKKVSSTAAAVVLIVALLSNLIVGAGAVSLLIPLLILGIVGAVLGLVLGKKYKAAPVFKKKEHCDYGKANHDFSHDSNRRLTQLQGFYKDGLIDRAEYEFLMNRWGKN